MGKTDHLLQIPLFPLSLTVEQRPNHSIIQTTNHLSQTSHRTTGSTRRSTGGGAEGSVDGTGHATGTGEGHRHGARSLTRFPSAESPEPDAAAGRADPEFDPSRSQIFPTFFHSGNIILAYVFWWYLWLKVLYGYAHISTNKILGVFILDRIQGILYTGHRESL